MAEEGFHDYTLATNLERLVAQVEQCLRGWMLTGLENISHMPPATAADKQPSNLVRVSNALKHKLPWREQPYVLTLHVPYTKEAELQAAKQQLQHQQQQQQRLQQQQRQIRHHQQQHASNGPEHMRTQRQALLPDASSAAESAAAAAAAAATAALEQQPDLCSPAAATVGLATSSSRGGSEIQKQATSSSRGGSEIKKQAATAKLQQQLIPLLGEQGAVQAAADAAAAAAGGANAAAAADGLPVTAHSAQFDQQVQELIDEYRQLHLQLQQDDQQQQIGEEAAAEGGHVDAAYGQVIATATATCSNDDHFSSVEMDSEGNAHMQQQQHQRREGASVAARSGSGGASGSSPRKLYHGPAAAAAAAAAATDSSVTSSSGSGAKSAAAAAAAAAVDALSGLGLSGLAGGSGELAQPRAKDAAPKLGRARVSSSSSGAAAAAAADEESEEGDEVTSREVVLPEPEALVLPNSTALAAVQAAVRLDQSRTAASRTWWPYCFEVQQYNPQQHNAQLALQGLGTALGQLSDTKPYQALPSLKPPWWAPVAGAHKLQRWFGLDLFCVLQPASYSKRLLDTAEASSLLSVGRIALSSSGVVWPLLLPVHDALRDAYWGVAQVHSCSVFFSTDSIHISRLPRHLTLPQQQLATFADQLAPHNPAAAEACLDALGEGSAAAAAATAAAAAMSGGAAATAAGSSRYWNHNSSSSGWLAGSSSSSIAQQQQQQQDPQQQQQQQQHQQGAGSAVAVPNGGYGVWMSACFTYSLPDASRRHWLQQQLSPGRRSSQTLGQTPGQVVGPQPQQPQQGYPGEHHRGSSGSAGEPGLHNAAVFGGNPHPGITHDDDDSDGLEWDADSPWQPWAQYRDPIKVLELDIIWQDRQMVHAADGDDAIMAPAAADEGAAEEAGWEQQQQQQQIGDRSSRIGGSSQQQVTAAAFGSTAAQPSGSAVQAVQAVQAVSPAGMSHLLSDVSSADHWLLHVLERGFSSSPLRQGRLGMRAAERHRRHVGVAATGADWLWTAELAATVLQEGGRLSGVCPQPYGTTSAASSTRSQGPPLDPGAFSTMLSALMTARTAAAAAGSLWELAGADWWEARGEPNVPSLPPDSVLDGVLRDLLSSPKPLHLSSSGSSSGSGSSSAAGASWQGGRAVETASDAVQQQQQQQSMAAAAAGSTARCILPRSAPAGSLLCRLACHALVFGNARAVAALWQRFVMQLRLQFWEQRALLPYMPAGSSSSSSMGGGSGGPLAPDMGCCLLHQKLQMLNVCIWRRDRRAGSRRSHSWQQQPQQQDLQSRAASSSVNSSRMNTPAPTAVATAGADDVLGTNAAADVTGSSSSSSNDLSRQRSLTAASSSFFSVTADDDNGDTAASAETDCQEATAVAAAVAAALSQSLGQEQQQEQQQQQEQAVESFEDAQSEFSNQSLSGHGIADNTSSSSNNGAAGYPSIPTAAAAAHESTQQQVGCIAVPDDSSIQSDLAGPVGVAGILPGEYVLNHPDRPLRIPVLQDSPVCTEDQIIERQRMLLQLAESSASSTESAGAAADGGDEDAEAAAAAATELLLLQQRLMAAPLLSDMSAFKAANPGCCLEDFVRWYSPRDWQQQQQQDERAEVLQQQQRDTEVGPGEQQQQQQDHHQQRQENKQQQQQAAPPVQPPPSCGQLSSRMSGCNNSWQQLWAVAPAQPAAAQKPLLNPHKEGEQVLHYLETLTPPALFSQLLAAAVCEALARLGSSRGAALPPAAAVVERFRSMAAVVLRKGGGLAESLAAAAGAGTWQQQQQYGLLAGDWQGAEDGLSDIELELLLAEFLYTEQVVVLAESLLHHLPGQERLAARLLQHLLHGSSSSSSTGSSSSSSSVSDSDSEIATDASVLGRSGLLPVARLSTEEKLGLLKWVAACRGEPGAALKEGGRVSGSAAFQSGSSSKQQYPYGYGGYGYLFAPQDSEYDVQYSCDSSTSTAAAAAADNVPSSTDGSTWTDTVAAAAGGGGISSVQASCSGDVGISTSSSSSSRQVVHRVQQLQCCLGDAAQREWVLTCGQPPSQQQQQQSVGVATPSAANNSSSSSSGNSSGKRLKPAVATAVAAAAAGSGQHRAVTGSSSSSSSGGGSTGGGWCAPASRMYVQAADGEMRIALVLASEQGQ